MRYVPRLDDAQIAEALRQNHALWGSGRSFEEHLAYNREQLERAGPEMLRYVGLVDDRGALVAAIKRYALPIVRGRAGELVEVRAVGIGAVFTNPARRKEGHAEVLLRAVLGEARDLGDAAAFLYSDIEPRYYERLGFRLLGIDEHEAEVTALPSEGALATRIATDDDLELVASLHPMMFADAPETLRIARCPATLRYFAWRNRTGPAHLLFEGDRVVGYAIASRDDPMRDLAELRGDSLWVDEIVAPGIERRRLLATVRALAASLGVARVRAWLRPAEVEVPFVARVRRECLPMLATLRGQASAEAPVFLGSFEHF
jgi:predicted N-acetyltransferase YhbS